MTTASLYCSRCGRVDDELGPDQCGSQVMGCPPPTPFDATKQALVRCGPCDKTRAIPVTRMMQGRGNLEGNICQRSECASMLVLPEVEKTERLAPPALVSADWAALELRALATMSPEEQAQALAGADLDPAGNPRPEAPTNGIDQAAKPRPARKAHSHKPKAEAAAPAPVAEPVVEPTPEPAPEAAPEGSAE